MRLTDLLYKVLAAVLAATFLLLFLPIVVIASVYTGTKAFCKKVYQDIIDTHLEELEEV